MSARDELGLSPKTEIFPKQDRLDEKTPYGNGITIAYRGCFTKDHNYKCVGLDVKDGLIVELRIGEFLDRATKTINNKHINNLNYFKKWEDYQDPVEQTEKISKAESKMTMKQILKAIKEKQEHSAGGTYDNWIILYIAKAVKGFKTDDEINQEQDEREAPVHVLPDALETRSRHPTGRGGTDGPPARLPGQGGGSRGAGHRWTESRTAHAASADPAGAELREGGRSPYSESIDARAASTV